MLLNGVDEKCLEAEGQARILVAHSSIAECVRRHLKTDDAWSDAEAERRLLQQHHVYGIHEMSLSDLCSALFLFYLLYNCCVLLVVQLA